jgi:hypothetical protein
MPFVLSARPEVAADAVYNYAKRVLETGLMFKCLIFLCKSPDYATFMCLLKLLAAALHVKSNKSKYSLEIIRYLIHHNEVLSQRASLETFYRQFVNTNGTPSGHIPADLQNEYIVKEEKEMLRHMYSGKSDKNIERRSAALFAASSVAKTYDSETEVLIRCTKHSTMSSAADEMEIINDLRAKRPFNRMNSGREHKGLPAVEPSCLSSLDLNEYTSWIRDKQIIYSKEIGK